MNVVLREEAVDRRSTQSLVFSKQVVEVVDVGNAGLRSHLLCIADVNRGSTGVLEGVVWSLGRDDDFGALGFELVDGIGHVLEVRVDNFSVIIAGRGQVGTRANTLLGVTLRSTTFVMTKLDNDNVSGLDPAVHLRKVSQVCETARALSGDGVVDYGNAEIFADLNTPSLVYGSRVDSSG